MAPRTRASRKRKAAALSSSSDDDDTAAAAASSSSSSSSSASSSSSSAAAAAAATTAASRLKKLRTRINNVVTAAAATTASELKKLRTTVDAVAEEWLCPISKELPLDPVTAEDGRVYDRKAIEEWLKKKATSPMTNESMGTRLFPAVQVRNTIKRMVEAGAWSGPKADGWRERLAGEKEVAEMRKKAEEGDGEAAWNLSEWYYSGLKGLTVDDEQAFQWAKRGADLGNATAMADCGWYYLEGSGVAKDVAQGKDYMKRSANAGSELGCYYLGRAYENGWYGWDKDEAEAKKWYEKMPQCDIRDVGDEFRKTASDWLRKRLSDVKEVAEARQKAEGGDGEAAYRLSDWYFKGLKGLTEDEEQAFQWAKRGADLGNATAMAWCGWHYAEGRGVAENVAQGCIYMMEAANAGSELGCSYLGDAFADGEYGLDKNEAEAKKWYEKMPQCDIQDCSAIARERISSWLSDHSDA